MLQRNFDVINYRSCNTRICLNIDKCAVVTCSKYNIKGKHITRTTNHKALSAIFDAWFQFSSHIGAICSNSGKLRFHFK